MMPRLTDCRLIQINPAITKNKIPVPPLQLVLMLKVMTGKNVEYKRKYKGESALFALSDLDHVLKARNGYTKLVDRQFSFLHVNCARPIGPTNDDRRWLNSASTEGHET